MSYNERAGKPDVTLYMERGGGRDGVDILSIRASIYYNNDIAH